MDDMLQSALPLELCGMIIDNLHDDERTLAVCALVCRNWVSFSRSRQFHTLVLSAGSRQRDKKLLLISEPSSTVPPYVRHLVMRQGRGRARRLDPRAFWVDEALPCIRVDDLIALDFLELSGVDLAKLSPESTRQLHCLCQRPRIVSLRFFGERSVVAVFRLLAMCRSMEIFHASARHEDKPQLTVAVPESFTIPPRLHTIELGGKMYGSAGALLYCKDTIHTVHTVRVNVVDCEDAPYVAAFLERFGPTVEQLTLNLSDMRFREREEHPEVMFCNAGGLLGSTGVRVINLSGNPAHLLLILKQVRSPLIERVSFHTTVPSSVNSFDANALDALFARAPFASARFQVLASDTDVQPLIDAREKVFAIFKNLREQGRLGFERAGGYAMDPATPPIQEAQWSAPFPSLFLATGT